MPMYKDDYVEPPKLLVFQRLETHHNLSVRENYFVKLVDRQVICFWAGKADLQVLDKISICEAMAYWYCYQFPQFGFSDRHAIFICIQVAGYSNETAMTELSCSSIHQFLARISITCSYRITTLVTNMIHSSLVIIEISSAATNCLHEHFTFLQ